jgi:hypothetical protein
MKIKLFLAFFGCFVANITVAQNLNNSWQLGLGSGITKFSKSDVSYIGEQYIFQLPRISLTMPIGERLSFDGAISFNTVYDYGFVKNVVRYFSMDGSLRYNFDVVINKVDPYVFVGGSLVDSERKMTPTLNVGAGGIFWISDRVGINPQVYYKHSLESFESMRSHFQGALGIIFELDWNNLFEGGNY